VTLVSWLLAVRRPRALILVAVLINNLTAEGGRGKEG
jgi:hypothetical protein